jgi:hypothetical protein
MTDSGDETPDEFYGLEHIKLAEDDLDKLIWLGPGIKLEDFLRTADNCIRLLKQSENSRQLVLETWLFIDYAVRELLLSALDIDKVNHEDYDLRYYALPRSFKACIDLLLRIKQTNEKLSPDPSENAIKMPGRFYFFLKREYPQFLDQFIEIGQQYYKKYHPELIKPKPSERFNSVTVFSTKLPEYRRVSGAWLHTTAGIDEDWKRTAIRLNDARNLAAHSYEPQKIAERLGYAGDSVTGRVRLECLGVIQRLTGIVPKAEISSFC